MMIHNERNMEYSHALFLEEAGRSIKNVTAFKTAAQVITSEMEETGKMPYERAASILSMYENAYSVVKKHFPTAECGTIVLSKANQHLIDLGCTTANTLFAQSICPDEINHESGDITELFRKQMGEVCIHYFFKCFRFDL